MNQAKSALATLATLSALASATAGLSMAAWAAGDGRPSPLKPVSAAATPIATQLMVFGAARAGKRVVTVGERGIVLLSDDHGMHFRRSRQVPLSSTLTAVSFSDPQHGWAVGEWDAILATGDGGETWRVQRLALEEDRPLFGVYFLDARHGVAVGLWSARRPARTRHRSVTPRTTSMDRASAV